MRCEFSSLALLNGYAQINIKAPLNIKAHPGQFLIIDQQFPCYVMGQSMDVEIIATPALAAYLQGKKNIYLSEPRGNALAIPQSDYFYLITAQDDALSAVIFYLKKYRSRFNGLVLYGTDAAFAFAPCPSRILIPQLPTEVIAAIPLFEDWGVANRLASFTESPGVFHGDVKSLATIWLAKNTTLTNIQAINLPAL